MYIYIYIYIYIIRRDKNINKDRTMLNGMDYFIKRLQYCLGIGLELLSAFLAAEVCQNTKVFLTRKEPLSMAIELLKLILWFKDQD